MEHKQLKKAFSLLELLLVMTILAVLMSFAVPAFSSIMSSQNVTRGGQMIADRIAFARQEAVSKNRDTEVRFYFRTNLGQEQCRAIQVWREDYTPAGPTNIPISRLAELPESVILATNATLSPLIANAPLAGASPKYRGFRIRANGLTQSAVLNGANFVTVHRIADTNSTPVNYFTIQIHPLTGKVTTYRPQ
jgi:uncharacterized protein (TIGR02596 family)